ncbi:hypothetical protein CVU37_14315 [candidate division BRC1 bacterium HGW-BRC1-1]|nr:MAG: hypothetical protein CVU37_14315 [candidate division BRC1 bacterium HGW-BRC1-1]
MNQSRKTDLRRGRLHSVPSTDKSRRMPDPGSGMDPLAEEILFDRTDLISTTPTVSQADHDET